MHDARGSGMDRRRFLKLAGGAGIAGVPWFLTDSWSQVQQVLKEIHALRPGEFTWHPELSPSGPVAIVVSLPDQRVHVYRNGIRIGVSTCSTGKPGHETPTGVFTILQKDRHHRSSTYNDAPMPNMNRLTWGGIALHAGKLPGYPASHGCVRLPMQFSEFLFTVTHVGTPVIIASAHSAPAEVVHPGLVLGQYAEHEFEQVEAHLGHKGLPSPSHEDNTTPPTSVLASGADQQVFVIENGAIVAEGKAFIKDPDVSLGSHVFILSNVHEGRRGLEWHAIGFHSQSASDLAESDESVIKRLGAEPRVLDAVKQRIHPGMVLVITDLPTHPDTRTAADFVIMTQDAV